MPSLGQLSSAEAGLIPMSSPSHPLSRSCSGPLVPVLLLSTQPALPLPTEVTGTVATRPVRTQAHAQPLSNGLLSATLSCSHDRKQLVRSRDLPLEHVSPSHVPQCFSVVSKFEVPAIDTGAWQDRKNAPLVVGQNGQACPRVAFHFCIHVLLFLIQPPPLAPVLGSFSSQCSTSGSLGVTNDPCTTSPLPGLERLLCF